MWPSRYAVQAMRSCRTVKKHRGGFWVGWSIGGIPLGIHLYCSGARRWRRGGNAANAPDSRAVPSSSAKAASKRARSAPLMSGAEIKRGSHEKAASTRGTGDDGWGGTMARRPRAARTPLEDSRHAGGEGPMGVPRPSWPNQSASVPPARRPAPPNSHGGARPPRNVSFEGVKGERRVLLLRAWRWLC